MNLAGYRRKPFEISEKTFKNLCDVVGTQGKISKLDSFKHKGMKMEKGKLMANVLADAVIKNRSRPEMLDMFWY